MKGEKKQPHVIDPEKCIKCGTCIDICAAKFDAIERISK
ncbi:MAG TPA: 4Fe-4S binding protein [Methanobacterium sp.]|nr:4Fe-4S binding protein [Methanobacterium sp.]